MEPERVTRRRRNPEERRRIAELCERSGLSQSEFAKHHSLSLSSLQRWLAEARSGCSDVPAVVFREVGVSPPPALSASAMWAIELVSPDGVTVRYREPLSFEELSRLLRDRTC
jgi:transposase